jgi:hypothetical protein
MASAVVLKVPDEFKNHSLAIALLLGGKLKRFVGSKKCKDSLVVRNLLDRTGYELWRSIEVGARVGAKSDVNCGQHIMEAFQLLACDWLLSTRVALWEQNKCSPGSAQLRAEFISGFRRDLSTLRHLIQFIPSAKTKLYLFEGSYRLVCGSNPLTAQAYFERTLRKRRQHGASHMICVAGEDNNPVSLSDQRDIAEALLQMSSNLPPLLVSCPGEREGYVREANDLLGRCSDNKLLL